MKVLRKFNNDFCNIVSDYKGTRAVGSEYGKQKMFADFILYYCKEADITFDMQEIILLLEKYFPCNAIKTAEEVVSYLIQQTNGGLSERYANSIFVRFSVLFSRKLTVNNYEFSIEYNTDYFNILENYPLAIEICDYTKKKLNLDFSKSEIQYVGYQLFIHKVQIAITNKQVESTFEKEIRFFIKNLSESLRTDLTDDEKLFSSLFYHMVPMVFRLKSKITLENPLLDDIKKCYPVLFHLTNMHLDSLPSLYGLELCDDEIGFIVLYIQTAIERTTIQGNIFVVCETGLVMSELLVNRIRKRLPSSINVDVIPVNQLTIERVKEADFLITTIDLSDNYRPFVRVSNLLDDFELKEVYDYYLKYSSTAFGGCSNISLDNLKKIKSYFKEDAIWINDNVDNYNQAIESVADKLQDMGYVEQNYKDDVINREILGCTYVSCGVSLPHASPLHVKSSIVGVLVMPNGCEWGKYKVYVMLLLAINQVNFKEFVNFLPLIYKKILDVTFIDNILQLKDPKEIYNLIFE